MSRGLGGCLEPSTAAKTIPGALLKEILTTAGELSAGAAGGKALRRHLQGWVPMQTLLSLFPNHECRTGTGGMQEGFLATAT